MKEVSLGKWRRLHQAASPQGAFTVLAIDHRGPLRLALTRQTPELDPDAALASPKEDIVAALAPSATAVLLDPEIRLRPCLRPAALPGQVGLLVALDTGSTGDPATRKTGLVPDWSPSRTVQIGGAGAKLLVYYHPDTPESEEVESLVARIAKACSEVDLPLYLEPLGYTPHQPGAPLPSAERRRVVLETARRLAPLGADILKCEFPLNVSETTDPAAWLEACTELTETCPIPWVLLSGGAGWETFVRQAETACRAGASGVMAGRAFWKEAVTPDPTLRREFLKGEARGRLDRLRAVCDEAARPFTSRLMLGETKPAAFPC